MKRVQALFRVLAGATTLHVVALPNEIALFEGTLKLAMIVFRSPITPQWHEKLGLRKKI